MDGLQTSSSLIHPYQQFIAFDGARPQVMIVDDDPDAWKPVGRSFIPPDWTWKYRPRFRNSCRPVDPKRRPASFSSGYPGLTPLIFKRNSPPRVSAFRSFS